MAQRPLVPAAARHADGRQGSGTLLVSPADTLSGTPIAAAPATNAVNVAIPEVTAQVVGGR